MTHSPTPLFPLPLCPSSSLLLLHLLLHHRFLLLLLPLLLPLLLLLLLLRVDRFFRSPWSVIIIENAKMREHDQTRFYGKMVRDIFFFTFPCWRYCVSYDTPPPPSLCLVLVIGVDIAISSSNMFILWRETARERGPWPTAWSTNGAVFIWSSLSLSASVCLCLSLSLSHRFATRSCKRKMMSMALTIHGYLNSPFFASSSFSSSFLLFLLTLRLTTSQVLKKASQGKLKNNILYSCNPTLFTGTLHSSFCRLQICLWGSVSILSLNASVFWNSIFIIQYSLFIPPSIDVIMLMVSWRFLKTWKDSGKVSRSLCRGWVGGWGGAGVSEWEECVSYPFSCFPFPFLASHSLSFSPLPFPFFLFPSPSFFVFM